MGSRYLLDSNTVIDYVGELLPEPVAMTLDSMFNEELNISIVVYIEVLGFNGRIESMKRLQAFLDMGSIYYVNRIVALQTIAIRKKHKIKLPDAIIAATAMVHNFTLLTRNTSDFKKIEGLLIANPHEL
ncbi:type II toxin-antitoxin system VapC family toxin [Larkinella terrae]|uniref:PIN domain-containing protein n=1 Tax=Larkinella terrae TaxID=2025311 RepID=A0A7K0EVE5_9BACT|nr:type II toxin-antitoxin system VapC family toxin [Larkinella terrae]MRS65793.1 PIN domain-containing protein [Larkinella terrae]